MFHFVNCTSSLEPVAESLADSFSAMCQSAPSGWRNTLGLSCSIGNGQVPQTAAMAFRLLHRRLTEN